MIAIRFTDTEPGLSQTQFFEKIACIGGFF